MDRKTLTSLNEAALQVQQNEAATHLPDSPDVVKYYGGRKRFDKLVAELKKKYESNKNKKNKQNFPSGGLTPAGKKWMEQGTQKKTDESVESRPINQQQREVIRKHAKNQIAAQKNLDRSGVPSDAPIRKKIADAHNSRMSDAENKIRLNNGRWDDIDTPDMVLEYFENYFGDSLNESVSDEDIMEAVYFLIDLTEAVLDAVGLNEK